MTNLITKATKIIIPFGSAFDGIKLSDLILSRVEQVHDITVQQTLVSEYC